MFVYCFLFDGKSGLNAKSQLEKRFRFMIVKLFLLVIKTQLSMLPLKILHEIDVCACQLLISIKFMLSSGDGSATLNYFMKL